MVSLSSLGREKVVRRECDQGVDDGVEGYWWMIKITSMIFPGMKQGEGEEVGEGGTGLIVKERIEEADAARRGDSDADLNRDPDQSQTQAQNRNHTQT